MHTGGKQKAFFDRKSKNSVHQLRDKRNLPLRIHGDIWLSVRWSKEATKELLLRSKKRGRYQKEVAVADF